MEKSTHQVKVNPSAPPPPPPPPPVQTNKSSIHQQNIVQHKSYPNFEHVNKHPVGTKSNFQPEVTRHAPDPPKSASHTANPVYQEQNERYCKKLHKHRRQTGSLTGGLFLLLVSGIHISWGIWRTGFWPITTNTSLLIFSIMAWPFGAIFGGFIGSALIMVLRKNMIYFIAAAVMIAGNLLHIIWDRNYASIVIGRLLISLSHGIVFLAIITQAGENASRNMRGTVLSTLNCILYLAIFISAHVTAAVDVNADFSAERILAIISLIFISASIICTITVTVESVPFLLRKNQAPIAMENLKHLRDTTVETPQITRELEEISSMIIQDKQDDENPFTNGNVKPLILVIAIRLMAALTNNFLLNYVLIGLCELILSGNYRYAPLLVVAPRLAMSILQVFYADVLGRKIQIIISATLAGLTLIGLGIVFNTVNITIFVNYYIPSIFCIHFQLFCGMAIQQMADVYLSEAFSTAKKPWSLSFVLGLEHLFHIFMIGMAFTTITSAGLYAMLYISGVLIFGMGIILIFTLPETKGKTMKQARDLFRSEKIFHLFDISSPYA